MADYNDYLKYLKHVDDTTAQDFKAKEDSLKKDISDLKAQFKGEISRTENIYNSNISDLKAQFNDEKSKIEKNHKADKLKIKELQSKINELQSELDNSSYEIQRLRKCDNQSQKQHNQLISVKVVCLCLGLVLSLFFSLISPIIAIPLAICFIYFIYKTVNKKNNQYGRL
jgi:predicted RNase H-like nuclease (RuvC/YqgF family)